MQLRAMVCGAWLLMPAAVLAADAGQDDARTLRSRMERRLTVLAEARRLEGDPQLFHLARAVPATAVLSRVEYLREPGRWTIELSKGTKADAEAILATLATQHACGAPAVTQAATGVVGSCTFASHAKSVAVRGAKAQRELPPPEERVLRERLVESQTELPDVADLDELKLQLADLGDRAGASGFSATVTGPTTMGPLDAWVVTLQGTAGFDDVALLVGELANMRRMTVIDSIELRQPRLRNGEWAVDFRIRTRTFRYRVEDERNDQELTVQTVERSLSAWVDDLPRNPFGAAGPVFAGSARAPKDTDCRKEGDTRPIDQLELDQLAVAYVAGAGNTACAMLVDDRGHCHELRRNDRLGRYKAVAIDGSEVRLVRFVQLADGHVKKLESAFKVTAKAKPPTWFCVQPSSR